MKIYWICSTCPIKLSLKTKPSRFLYLCSILIFLTQKTYSDPFLNVTKDLHKVSDIVFYLIKIVSLLIIFTMVLYEVKLFSTSVNYIFNCILYNPSEFTQEKVSSSVIILLRHHRTSYVFIERSRGIQNVMRWAVSYTHLDVYKRQVPNYVLAPVCTT